MSELKEKLINTSLRSLSHIPIIKGKHKMVKALSSDPAAAGEYFQNEAKRLILPILDRAGLRVLRAENIPLTGPIIIAPSHIDQTDPFAAAQTVLRYRPDLEFRVLAKHQLDRPVVRDFLVGSAEFYNRLRGPDESEEERMRATGEKMLKLATMVAAVEGGHGAGMIFPWGTREDAGSLPIAGGVLLFASELADITDQPVPIVPVGIGGNSIGRYATRILFPRQSEPAVVASIAPPVWIRPGYRRRIAEGGMGCEEVMLIRRTLRLVLHAHTHEALVIAGQSQKFEFLDEPSDPKKAARVAKRRL